MKAKLTAFLLLISALPAWAADLIVVGPANPKRDEVIELRLDNAPANSLFYWQITPKVKTIKVGNKIHFAAPPGSYSVEASAVSYKLDGTTVIPSEQTATFEFKVVGAPDPGPGPGPTPTPTPVGPISVLITYESSTPLPAEQSAVLTSKVIHEYLDSKCKSGTEGRKDWFIADKDVSLSRETQTLQDAGKKTRSSLPWIQIIPASGTPFEGPLPANVASTLELLKKYGG